MSEKVNFARTAELRAKCVSQANALSGQLKDFEKNVLEFYEIMRWKSIDCSTAEYEVLFDHFIYEFENLNVETAIQRLRSFLNSLTETEE